MEVEGGDSRAVCVCELSELTTQKVGRLRSGMALIGFSRVGECSFPLHSSFTVWGNLQMPTLRPIGVSKLEFDSFRTSGI